MGGTKYWFQQGHTRRSIALVFDVGPDAITDINTGRTWRHVRMREKGAV